MAHAVRTTTPSRIVRMPQSAPVIPVQDMLVERARVRMNSTTLLSTYLELSFNAYAWLFTWLWRELA